MPLLGCLQAHGVLAAALEAPMQAPASVRSTAPRVTHQAGLVQGRALSSSDVRVRRAMRRQRRHQAATAAAVTGALAGVSTRQILRQTVLVASSLMSHCSH